MKSLLFMFGYFLLIISSCVQAINWEKCGSGKQILDLQKLSISPHPIRLSGKTARVSVQVKIHENITSEARIQIKIWKDFLWGIYIPGPCFLPTGCDVKLCKFLEYFKSECPVTAGLYESNDAEFEIPVLGRLVKWFAAGSFKIELKMTGTNSEQLTCWTFKGKTKALFSPWDPNIISLYMENETSV